MVSYIPFSVTFVRSYFRSMQVERGANKVKADIISDKERLSFQITLTSSEISYCGSYPKSRISLERHGSSRGHSGVHLQISYHKVDNPLNIGTVYVILDVDSNETMQNVAEGFIFSLYEMLGKMDESFIEMRSALFYEDLVKDLEIKKKDFIQIVSSGIDTREVEVIELDGSRRILSRNELSGFLEKRNELIPILGLIG